MTNTIDSNSYLSSVQQQTTTSSTLGKDDFMKILVTQLQNQDPSSPLEDKDFIAQMATFSSLEQMTNLNNTMTNYVKDQNNAQLLAMSQYIGKQVDWTKLDSTTGVSTSGSGTISSIVQSTDGNNILLEDGNRISVSDIQQLLPSSNEASQLLQASYLIGKTITWNDGSTNQSSTVSSVQTKNSQVIVNTSNRNAVSLNSILSIQ